MEIKSLVNTDFETLAKAFGMAFAQYEVQITNDELRTMLRRRGFNPALSFAAFDNTGRIAGFTLNGIGTFGGVPMAYDTGTGTLPEYRGRGLASQIFETSLPHLRTAGISQYLLEVLQHNTTAVSVYRRLEFEISREFNYFRAESSEVRVKDQVGNAYKIRQVESAALREIAPQFWDFNPSWQNCFEAIERALDDFVILGAFDGDRLVGYVIFEPTAGDITQISVAKTHRRQGIGSALLKGMLSQNRAPGVKCINTEVGCDTPIINFLQAAGIPLVGKQFEMIKKL